MARRVPSYGKGAKGKAEGSAKARRPAPAAPAKNVRNGKPALTRSKQPEKMTLDTGETLEDTRKFLTECMQDGAVNKMAFAAYAALLIPEYHHARYSAQFLSVMTPREHLVHLRRVNRVDKMLQQCGLTPESAQRLGLMQAREQNERAQVRPKRDHDHLVKVASLIDSLGIIPQLPEVQERRRRRFLDIESTATDATDVDDAEPLDGDAEKSTGVSHIFDRKM